MNVQIAPSWKKELEDEFSQPYFSDLISFLKKEKTDGKTIFPPGPLIFNAFNETPFDAVKVVILGQDPYHNHGQAHGLSFSVPDGVRPPPSLLNIFKELQADLGIEMPQTGNLTPWAKQGVLMLNAALTVAAHTANSHSKAGWYPFTDSVIRHISDDKAHVVFILWGKFAQGKEILIDRKKHLILKAAHPSPYSADNGFFGSRPFGKTNHWLEAHDIAPVDWKL